MTRALPNGARGLGFRRPAARDGWRAISLSGSWRQAVPSASSGMNRKDGRRVL